MLLVPWCSDARRLNVQKCFTVPNPNASIKGISINVAANMNAVSSCKYLFQMFDLTFDIFLIFPILDLEKIANISKTRCWLDHKEYVKGERMYPEQIDCYSCICDEGFDNSTILYNSHCRKIKCHIEVRYADRLHAGCIPIYYGKATCCPIGWRCRKFHMDFVFRNRLFLKSIFVVVLI